MSKSHISIERMRDVVTNCDAEMTEAEKQHIQSCQECLAAFGELVVPKDQERDVLSSGVNPGEHHVVMVLDQTAPAAASRPLFRTKGILTGGPRYFQRRYRRSSQRDVAEVLRMRSLVLDTHALLWYWNDSPELSPTAASAIE